MADHTHDLIDVCVGSCTQLGNDLERQGLAMCEMGMFAVGTLLE
jgi:hypothetical protein|tara:strand:- start:3605 stop:3736 length:132 start_codon:yes stop_codon:yes gene_type:complete